MSDGDDSRSLCIFCGEDALRLNLYTCSSCGRQPSTAHDVAYAMAFSGVVMNDASLDRLAEHMRSGKSRPTLPPAMYDEMLELANGIDLDHMFAAIAVQEGHRPH
jgi:hypothetical protein